MVVNGLSLSHENLVVGQGVGAVLTELKGRHSWVFYLNEMGWNSSGSMLLYAMPSGPVLFLHVQVLKTMLSLCGKSFLNSFHSPLLHRFKSGPIADIKQSFVQKCMNYMDEKT